MKLHRYFLAYFRPKPKQTWVGQGAESNGVKITINSAVDDETQHGELGLLIFRAVVGCWNLSAAFIRILLKNSAVIRSIPAVVF